MLLSLSLPVQPLVSVWKYSWLCMRVTVLCRVALAAAEAKRIEDARLAREAAEEEARSVRNKPNNFCLTLQ